MDFFSTDNDALIPIAVGLIFAVVIGVAIGSAYKNKKRREANRLLADKHGWHYMDEDSSLTNLANSEPFGKGYGRRARGVARGAHRDHDFVTFGYEYYTESRDSDGNTDRDYHHFTVSAVNIGAHLPVIRLTPEGFGAKFVKAFGARDLEVESHAFNERWRVWTEEDKVAHAILPPDMIAHLLKPEYEDFPLIIENGLLYTFRDGKQDLSDLYARLDPLVDMLAEVPDFVLDEHRS